MQHSAKMILSLKNTLYCRLFWVLLMLSVVDAECCWCWVLLMLSVVDAECCWCCKCCWCWVLLMLRVVDAERCWCWVLLMLSVVDAECHCAECQCAECHCAECRWYWVSLLLSVFNTVSSYTGWMSLILYVVILAECRLYWVSLWWMSFYWLSWCLWLGPKTFIHRPLGHIPQKFYGINRNVVS